MKKRNKSKKQFVDKSVVYEQLQLEAIEGVLTNSNVSFERKVRRWYSQNFSTPLKETFSIPWDEILIHYYEDAVTGREHNEIFEAAVEYIPELVKEREREDAELDKELELEQQRGLERKKKRDAEREKRRKDGSGETTPESSEIQENEGAEKTSVQEDREMAAHGRSEEVSQSLKPKEMNLDFDDIPEDDSE